MPDEAPLTIRPAAAEDIPELAALFDAYRVFYQAGSAPAATAEFVARLLAEGRTRFFLARGMEARSALLGFVHLMPSINTVAMRPIWLLEDLFVTPEARRRGVAAALMRHAEHFARETGAERLTLATAHDNLRAQSLYRGLGYVREEHFWYFHRVLD
jgi:ribosomal protein S18 acetylase RimI-like enzyme